jgi:hypothetical protein
MANTLLTPITILPASPSDYYSLALLEGTVFSPEEFSQVAFGPQQLSHGNLCSREKKLASHPREKGSRNVVMKAVINEGEKERIVGCSGWTFALGREGNGGAEEVGEKEAEEIKDGTGKGEEEGGWGTGAKYVSLGHGALILDILQVCDLPEKALYTESCSIPRIFSSFLMLTRR